jgi:hypothetical protein
LYIVYNCKLQRLTYPYVFIPGQPEPWNDIPGTRRRVSWRLANEGNLGGSGVSISMQAAVTVPESPLAGVSVRMVCWSVWDTSQGNPPPLVDYGLGVTSATLTILPVGGIA